MDMPDFDLIFTTYQKEIIEDIKVDELSLKDKTMLVPTIKHKWVGRLMVHKDQLRKFNDTKKKYIRAYIDKTGLSLSKNLLEQKLETDPTFAMLSESIDKLEIVIEYLEKVEKLVGSLTFDCKNIIDLQKLETT